MYIKKQETIYDIINDIYFILFYFFIKNKIKKNKKKIFFMLNL